MKLYPANDDTQAKQAYHDVYRDINFAGHRTWARLQSSTGKSPAWLYLFSHVPPHPEGNGNNPRPPLGAVHFSEVIYVFNNLRMKDYRWTDLDRNVADSLAAYWTNFAKTGNPNGLGLTNWPIYNAKDEFLLNIGDPVRLERFNSAGIYLIAAVQEELRRRPTAAGALIQSAGDPSISSPKRTRGLNNSRGRQTNESMDSTSHMRTVARRRDP